MKNKDFVKRMLAMTERENEIALDYEELARDAGWVRDCGYADCCWRWSKKFKDVYGEENIIQCANAEECVQTETSILAIQDPKAWPPSKETY